jgi:hypothetical protein
MENNFKNFITHNKKHFKKTNIINNNDKILIEFNGWSSTHIWGSYLVNVLLNKYKCKILAYEGYTLISSDLSHTIYFKIKYFLAKKIFGKFFKIYKSFGIDYFIRPKIDKYILLKSKKKFKDLLKKIKNKKDVLNIKINNVLIGDLIYDTYLKNNKLATINIKDKKFNFFFLESVKLFYYWQDYFKNNNIKSLIIVHPTYLYGIPMRIACNQDVPVYRATFNQITYISKKNYVMGEEFFSYPSYFKNIKTKLKINAISESKKILEKILLDKKEKKNNQTKLPKIANNTKVSVLIAIHDFYDSPHVYGNMLFSDFYEWIKYLVNISKKTNYDWYIKPHPECSSQDLKLIKQIIKKNSKICILSSKATHSEILKKGVNTVLTCYGTVGYEYAYLGLTVVNASPNNPYRLYSFVHTPKTIKKYENIILNLKKFKLKPSKKKILEFFFVRRLYLVSNWLFIKRDNLSKNFGWKTEIYKPSIYKEWLNQWSQKKHKIININLKKFINSKKNRFISKDYD